jgi:hypothetical protein
MILLADQPTLNVADLTRLAETWWRQPGHMVATQYADTIGVPVFRRDVRVITETVRRSWREEATGNHADQVIAIPIPRAAFDIDVPVDISAYQTRATAQPKGAEVSRASILRSAAYCGCGELRCFCNDQQQVPYSLRKRSI